MASEPTSEPEPEGDEWIDRHDRRFMQVVEIIESIIDTQASILKRLEANEKQLEKLTADDADDGWWRGENEV